MRACGRVIGGGCALACVHACVCTRVRVCVCACMHGDVRMRTRTRAYADARCVMPNRHPTFPHLPHLTRPRPRLRPTPTCTSPLTLMTPVRTLTPKKQARPRRGLSVSQVQVPNQQHIFTRPPTPSEPSARRRMPGCGCTRVHVCVRSRVCVCVCVCTRANARPSPSPSLSVGVHRAIEPADVRAPTRVGSRVRARPAPARGACAHGCVCANGVVGTCVGGRVLARARVRT